MRTDDVHWRHDMKKINWIRKVLLVAAIALILAGISRKDFTDIKNKAIRICYECIGIG